MIIKTAVVLDKNDITLSLPFSKVDVEKRLVSGFATLDNEDSQSDILTSKASNEAFVRFKGNLREMHSDTLAVGRVVDFSTKEFYDVESGNTYDGVYVTSYVSKGAESTWQKVLDGTLSGFSIAGIIGESENAVNTKTDKPIRIVHGYDLNELSLVDNPANDLAQVVSIQKNDDGSVSIKTPLVTDGLENIFYCSEDSLALTKSDDKYECPACRNDMDNIGFVESNDTDKESVIKSSLNELKSNLIKKEGVNEVTTENTDTLPEVINSEVSKNDDVEETVEKAEVEEDTTEEVVSKSDEAAEEVGEEVVEKSEQAADVVASDKIDEISALLTNSLTKLADAVGSINDRLDTLTKSVDSTKSDVQKSAGEIEEFGKRVNVVEETTAFKKSGDIGDVAQAETHENASPWGGTFLNTANL